jgi:hypothetical protein
MFAQTLSKRLLLAWPTANWNLPKPLPKPLALFFSIP